MHSYLTSTRAHQIIIDTILAGQATKNTTAIIAAAKDGGFPVLGGAKLYYKEYGWVLCGHAMDCRDVLMHVPEAEIREFPLPEACAIVNQRMHVYDLNIRARQMDDYREMREKRRQSQSQSRQHEADDNRQREEYYARYGHLSDAEMLFEHEPVTRHFSRSKRYGTGHGGQKLDRSSSVRKTAVHRTVRRRLNQVAHHMALGIEPNIKRIRLPRADYCWGWS